MATASLPSSQVMQDMLERVAPSHTAQGLGAIQSQNKEIWLTLGMTAMLAAAATILKVSRHPQDQRTRELVLEKAHAVRKEASVWGPDIRWTEPTKYTALFFAMTIGMAVAVLHGNFEVLRVVFTVMALSLLAYRFFFYSKQSLLLYMFDLCYWVHISVVYALWFGSSGDRESALWYSFAIFTSTVGPVGGASFMLQTPFLLHHPEAFESFFLHVMPMWVSYAVRWRLKAHLVDSWQPFTSILWVGAIHVYLPWAIFMVTLLIVKPWLPVVSQYQTLFDWYTGSVSTESKPSVAHEKAPKPQFLSYAWKPVAYILMHGLFSLEGYAAAAMCFQYEAVNILWLMLVFVGNVKCAYVFYRSCADPSYGQHNKLAGGLLDSAVSWSLMLPLYYACWAGYV